MALVIMSLHPNPSSNILLPFMHPNLAQICGWWAASTIISDTFDDAVFQQEYVIASDSPISLHRDAFHNDLAYLHCPKQCSKSQAKCPPHLFAILVLIILSLHLRIIYLFPH